MDYAIGLYDTKTMVFVLFILFLFAILILIVCFDWKIKIQNIKKNIYIWLNGKDAWENKK